MAGALWPIVHGCIVEEDMQHVVLANKYYMWMTGMWPMEWPEKLKVIQHARQCVACHNRALVYVADVARRQELVAKVMEASTTPAAEAA